MIRRLDRNDLLLLALAAGKLLLNVAFHGRYGWFRDELYYLACSDHLAWGYVDQPPLSIAILAATRALAGDSIWAVRFPAALAGAVAVVLTGLIARRLGGGRFAQLLAALAVALSGVVLGNAGRFFSMNAFDLMLWAAASYVLVVLLEQERPRLWLAFGAIAGLGLLNKYSMLFLGLGVVVGLVATSQRRHFARRWIWLGGLVAALIVLPHVLWEVRNGWPSIEFMRNASGEKNVALSPLAFLRDQVMMFGIAQAPLWIAGLAFFAFHRDGRRLRPLAWLYPVVFFTMVFNGAKAYYLTPIYFPYLAAGAVWLERGTVAAGASRLLRPAAVVALLVLGAISLPFAIPVLPVDRFVVYARALGQAPRAEENHELAELPQYYADMFGWEELAEGVGRIARERLSEAEREQAVVYVRNYG
ncbi:MAG TPA: glycosyltransferase family 39 protein, partial [Thermoanaerobaculia bacterium]|nr:glycosyltransferase family 39 protein [Thermoanaerobaculia bacterium]